MTDQKTIAARSSVLPTGTVQVCTLTSLTNC